MAGLGESATLSPGRVRGELIHDWKENRRALVALGQQHRRRDLAQRIEVDTTWERDAAGFTFERR
ncbi:MAG: hypothetical protein ACRDY4_08030 [Acidimicrobiia bacterium]